MRKVAPIPGCSPSCVKLTLHLAVSEIIRISVEQAKLKAAPIACPFTAAMVGNGNLLIIRHVIHGEVSVQGNKYLLEHVHEKTPIKFSHYDCVSFWRAIVSSIG
jgi:hypothetical protein